MRKISKDYGQILVDNKILVSILTHRCQCPHGIPKTGGVRGGATHIHKRKLSSEPHVKKRYKLGNHLFHIPDRGIIFQNDLNHYFEFGMTIGMFTKSWE